MIKKEIKYRLDLDGLRGLSVVSVILYHFYTDIFPYGYLGVDIFFVISGFLITKIILFNKKSNQFDLWFFYQKRIVRLFPSLIALFVMTFIASYFYLLPSEFANYMSELICASSFTTNLCNLREITYFEDSSRKSIFLNLWSLGVEEQFYLVWPLVFYFMGRIKKIRVLVLVMSCLSFLLFTYHSGNVSYYSPLHRFWQIGVGALLVLYTISAKQLLLFFSLCLFLALAGQYVFSLEFNWFHTIPVLLSSLVVLGFPLGLKKVIEYRPLVWLGKISYPLYLFHWPFLSYFIIFKRELDAKLKIVFILISIILSIIAYYLLEQPIKSRFNKKRSCFIPSLLMLLLLIIFLSSLIIEDSNFFETSKSLYENNVTKASTDIHTEFKSNKLTTQKFKSGAGYHKLGDGKDLVVFIGDSLIHPLFARAVFLSDQGKIENKTVYLFSIPGCPTLLKLKTNFTKNCKLKLNEVIDFISANDGLIKNIVFFSFWQNYYYNDYHEMFYYDNSDDYLESLLKDYKNTINLLQSNTDKLYIIESMPMHLELLNPGYILKRTMSGAKIDKSRVQEVNGFVRNFYKNELEKINYSYIKKIHLGEKINFLSFESIFKKNGAYSAFDQDMNPFFSDGIHLRNNIFYSRGSELDKTLIFESKK